MMQKSNLESAWSMKNSAARRWLTERYNYNSRSQIIHGTCIEGNIGCHVEEIDGIGKGSVRPVSSGLVQLDCHDKGANENPHFQWLRMMAAAYLFTYLLTYLLTHSLAHLSIVAGFINDCMLKKTIQKMSDVSE